MDFYGQVQAVDMYHTLDGMMIQWVKNWKGISLHTNTKQYKTT